MNKLFLTYPAIFTFEDNQYWVEFIDLKGCFSSGSTLPEAMEKSKEAMGLFLEDLKERGKTIILSTHIFSLVEKLCDRVGIIMDGKMIVCDTLENLTKETDLEDKFFQICSSLTGEQY